MAELDGDQPRRYKDGNTGEDGSYLVGRGRPPERGKFRKDDGRPRGRRPKGGRNVDTYLLQESETKITVNENGQQVRITKQEALVKRFFDVAFGGNVSALKELVSLIEAARSRKADRGDRALPEEDQKLIAAYFQGLLKRAEEDGEDELLPDPDEQDADDDR